MKKIYVSPTTEIAVAELNVSLCDLSGGGDKSVEFGGGTKDNGITDIQGKSRDAWSDDGGLW